jgi:phosphatidylserine decarboxylase
MSIKRNVFYDIAGFLSVRLWGRFSDSCHFAVSQALAKFYETRLSRYFIVPYCLWQYGDKNYYKRFKPGNNKSSFETFQDFFTRDLITEPQINSDAVWPCEGFLCELGPATDFKSCKVKGEERRVETVFGISKDELKEDEHFSNVFLHNNNYHHIHAPVSGVISRIQHIPGALLFLRPWAYRKNPSLPALTNERYNVDILDKDNKRWCLSIVGGPLVATINLKNGLNIGSNVRIGEKIASFAMGSTCCMLSPIPPKAKVGQLVDFGDSITTDKC